MKVSELFEAAKAPSYKEIKKHLDELYLRKLKVASDVKNDIASTLRTTDEFHSDGIHSIESALSKNNMDSVTDHAHNYIEELGERVSDYYADKMNFGDDYKVVKIPSVSMSSKEIDDFAEFVKPGYKAEVKASSLAKNKAASTAHKAKVKTLTPEVLGQVAKVIKKYAKAGWNDFASTIKKQFIKNGKAVPGLGDYAPTGVDIQDLADNSSTGEKLKQFCAANFSPSDYLSVSADNLTTGAMAGKMSDDEKDILDNLTTIQRDKKLTAQLVELIK